MHCNFSFSQLPLVSEWFPMFDSLAVVPGLQVERRSRSHSPWWAERPWRRSDKHKNFLFTEPETRLPHLRLGRQDWRPYPPHPPPHPPPLRCWESFRGAQSSTEFLAGLRNDLHRFHGAATEFHRVLGLHLDEVTEEKEQKAEDEFLVSIRVRSAGHRAE